MPLALMALAAGALLITPFLNSVSTSVLATGKERTSIVEQYAADAGIEDAIWTVTHGGIVVTPGTTFSYLLGEAVNGFISNVSITRVTPGGGGQGGGQGGGTPGKLYDIVSSAGNTTISASVNVHQGNVNILSWQRN